MKETVRHFGKLDILVNAAAGNFLASAEDLSPNAFKTGLLPPPPPLSFLFN